MNKIDYRLILLPTHFSHYNSDPDAYTMTNLMTHFNK